MADSANPMAIISADMLSSIPADIMSEFNAAADLPDPVGSEVGEEAAPPIDDGQIETSEPAVEAAAETEGAVGEPIVPEPETETPPVETKPPAKDTAPGEELPDGVTAGKNRKGEEGYFVRKDRWENVIHADHKMVREVSELIGEPATMEAFTLRDKSYQAQEKMFSDLESGDPAAQAKVLDFIFNELASAKQSGRVGADPTVPLARSFYSSLQAKSPEAYGALRGQAARDLVKEMYSEAARSGDKNLFLSVGHVARWLAQSPDGDPAAIRATAQRMGIPFHTPEEMEGLARGADPLTQAQQRIQMLEQQVNGRTTDTRSAEFGTWVSQTGQSTRTAVSDEVLMPALKPLEAAWKPFAKDYDSEVVKPLREKVYEVLNNDPAFQSRIANLTAQAQRATSPQFRAQLASQIQQAHVNRARLALEAVKRPVLDRANSLLKAKSNDTHARRQAGSTRTAPQGQTAPVPRSLVPPSVLPKVAANEVYDPQKAYKLAAQLLG